MTAPHMEFACLVFRWRRLDRYGLELCRLRIEGNASHATSTLIDAGPEPFAVDYEWQLDESWRTTSLLVRSHQRDTTTLQIVRRGDATWSVDGAARPDLDGCTEIDLSATPFCNTLALR